MTNLLQIHIEFPENAEQGDLTKEALKDTIEKIFLEMGIEPDVIQREIEDIDIRKESSLGVDPGTAALIVATIGVGIDLIKLGVDLYKQDRELRLEREKLAFEQEKHKNEELVEQTLELDIDKELAQAFVDSVLLSRLIEQHNLQLSSSSLRLV